MNVTTADTAAMDPIVYALNHQRVQDAELAREMADGHAEALAAELASIQDDLNALDTTVQKLESVTLGDPGTPGRRY